MSERNVDIEAKLVALLELSKSSAEGTEHEAKLALETAIRLAAKHGISLSTLAEKRKAYAGDWFQGTATPTVEYTADRFADVPLQKWCELAEEYGWERHRRTRDDLEGLIFMYRQPNRMPKLEVRIFERPWLDIEFEVLRHPDPVIGHFEDWMHKIFDVDALGVTYFDFKEWLQKDRASAA